MMPQSLIIKTQVEKATERFPPPFFVIRPSHIFVQAKKKEKERLL